MTRRERILLAFSVLGFVVPNVFVTLFGVRFGPPLGPYFHRWLESLPATQLAFDIGWSFIAFTAWATWEGRRVGISAWWVIPASLLVGLCFALPLFLYFRERAVRRDRMAKESGREPSEIGDGAATRSAVPLAARPMHREGTSR